MPDWKQSSAYNTRAALQPTKGREAGMSLKKSRSTPSLRKTWRKLFGLQEAEPEFEIVTPEEVVTPPNEEDEQRSEGTVADEFGVLDSEVKPNKHLSDDDDRASETSDGTLVDDIHEPVIVSLLFTLSRVYVHSSLRL